MLHIAITGIMGSGKSFVSRIFHDLGIPLYLSDIAGKRLMQEDESVVQSIKALLGKEAYSADGKINSKWISEKVFNDFHLLRLLNNIVHPAVKNDFETWHQKQRGIYTLQESALTFESGHYLVADFVIVVRAPVDLCFERVAKRDQISRPQFEERIKYQWSQEEKIKYADFVINNDQKKLLLPQIQHIHREIHQLAKTIRI